MKELIQVYYFTENFYLYNIRDLRKKNLYERHRYGTRVCAYNDTSFA